MAAFHFRDHLDRIAVVLYFGGHAFDEGARAGSAGKGVSGVDVASDGVVPMVGAGDGDSGHALLFFVADFGCAQFRESGTGAAVVWLVGAGVDGGVRGDLFSSASSQGNSRFSVGAGDWYWRDCDCGFLAGDGAERRGARLQRALGDQRGRRARASDVAEYVGRGLARAEEIDCVDARGSGAGDAYASGGREDDAVGISYRANVFVAFVSDAVFHGSC